ncbi:GNAT family N-acetyltransferase [Empedobacter brevis]|uniref:GNAT family N-acetyltransferase n=1 Tax=Empedobacter brevis TaxID=247 RepID=UPI00333FFC7B
MKLFNTERLIVRRFKESDGSALFDYFEKPRVNCFIDEKLNSIEEANTEVLKRIADVSQFVVCLLDDTLIGNLFAYAEHENDTFNLG